jgi:hypothetical protein
MAYGNWTEYEWDVERVATAETEEFAEGDITDHFHQSSAQDCIKHIQQPAGDGFEWRIALVLDTQDGRSWAYVNDDMTIDKCFEDAYERKTRVVPQRFHKELAKAITHKE